MTENKLEADDHRDLDVDVHKLEEEAKQSINNIDLNKK
jgi:hypothetical protein